MGYFDGLTSGSFKTTEDGRKLFFPWGYLGRGYTIASDEDYNRLRLQTKIYLMVALTVIVCSAFLRVKVNPIGLGAILIASYAVWTLYQVRRLQPANESLSLRESMTTRGVAFGPVVLWLLEICSLVLVGSGIAIFFIEPGSWLASLASILFFGVCAAAFAWMLFLRRKA
jgi:hypothetical protein